MFLKVNQDLINLDKIDCISFYDDPGGTKKVITINFSNIYNYKRYEGDLAEKVAKQLSLLDEGVRLFDTWRPDYGEANY